MCTFLGELPFRFLDFQGVGRVPTAQSSGLCGQGLGAWAQGFVSGGGIRTIRKLGMFLRVLDMDMM